MQRYAILTISAVDYVCALSVTSEPMDQYFRRVLGIESGLREALDVIDEQPVGRGGSSGAAADRKR